MNKELLIKLIKLANNNNSEGEANSAARRVCKMIMEDNFSIIGGDPSAKSRRDKPFTYQDVRRSPEPEFKSKPPNRPGTNPFQHAPIYDEAKEFTDADYEALLKRMRSDRFNIRNSYVHFFYGGHRGGKKSWVDEAFNKESKEKPNRLLKCRTCGRESFTKFQGRDDFYECVECWNPANRKEPK